MSVHHISPGPSSQPFPSKLKQKLPAVGIGIAAGAEDAKYHTKYKDLKRKVKEIEVENDKLQVMVLQAKKNIQRMRVERAVLYDRLSATSQVPEAQDNHATAPYGVPDHPSHPSSTSAFHLQRDSRDYRQRVVSQRSISEYNTPPDHPLGHSSRSITANLARSPSLHSPSKNHSESYELGHHLSHYPRSSAPPMESSIPRSHVIPPLLPHAASHHRSWSPSPPSHSRSRSRQSSYMTLPPAQYHSEPMQSGRNIAHGSSVVEWEKSRRHEAVHEYSNPYNDFHGGSRHSAYSSHHSPSNETRPPVRVHNHQRSGHNSRDEQHDSRRDADWDSVHEQESSRDLDYSRDAKGSHILSSHTYDRYRRPIDRDQRPEQCLPSRTNDDQNYYRDASNNSLLKSRSGTPGSGSGIGGGEGTPSLSESRSRYYGPDCGAARTYKLRSVNATRDDLEFVHEDGRSVRNGRGDGGTDFPPLPPLRPEHNRSSLGSKKRSHNEMDIDDHDADSIHAQPLAGRVSEERLRR